MPEGDTVHKLAAYLRGELAGRVIIAGHVRAGELTDLAGVRVASVDARGKHLFITFDDQRILRSHLGMWGSWHAYAPGEPWRKPAHRAVIVLDTGLRVFVCFHPLQVELLRSRGVRSRRLAEQLGPDLLDASLDIDTVVERARRGSAAALPLCDLLLDQRIACGVGNVYKSEVLFLAGLHPATELGSCSDRELAGCYRLGADLLRRNTGGGPRVTRFVDDDGGRLWVYGRAGRRCLRCGSPVERAPMGRDLRVTYWCATCQPLSPGDRPVSAG